MPEDLHQRILALLAANPEVVIALWRAASPELDAVLGAGERRAQVIDANLRARQIGAKDRHLLPDLVVTLDAPTPSDGPAKLTAIVECQLSGDHDKLYTWVEYLAAARRRYKTRAEVLVISPVDRVIAWAHALFAEEPHLRPVLIGPEVVPAIDDPDRAVRMPALAILSAVFHGGSERSHAVLTAAAAAMKTLPPDQRREWFMLLEDALPEDKMQEIRKVTAEDATAAANEWLRTRGPYVIGHREGIEQGLEQGREQGLEQGLRRALALVLELRSLQPSAAEQARIDGCHEPALLDRWAQRAKTATTVAELFEP